MQAPAASTRARLVAEPPRLMLMFEESQTKLPTTLLSAAPDVLQTREPAWKEFGPTLVLLLSSPMMSHVTVLMVNCARAVCAHRRQTKSATTQRSARPGAPARGGTGARSVGTF